MGSGVSSRVWRIVQARLRFAFRDAVLSALAAVLAWKTAQSLWGHATPTFAAVAVVVCLAPGLPSHLKQTWSMLLGCVMGIVIAELAWQLPNHHPMLLLGGSVFVALLMGCLLSPTPVAAIQAAVSVLLVWAMGPQVAGEIRLLDVTTGAVIGLLFSQIVFTEDPIKSMSFAARKLLQELGQGLAAMQAACTAGDAQQAEQALAKVTQAYVSLTALQTAVEQGRQAAKWSLRGRWRLRQVNAQVGRYGRHAARLYGTSLLLAEGMARSLAHADAPAPEALQSKLAALSSVLRHISLTGWVKDAAEASSLAQVGVAMQAEVFAQLPPGAAGRWRLVDEYASQVAQAVVALLDSKAESQSTA